VTKRVWETVFYNMVASRKLHGNCSLPSTALPVAPTQRLAHGEGSTLQSNKENQTYIITASQMTSGLVLKSRNGECFVTRRSNKVTLPASRKFNLTEPLWVMF
tara:strand:+ start:17 stop:325 length:309 start_codon:yes stop_codon:yes gene_type:complete